MFECVVEESLICAILNLKHNFIHNEYSSGKRLIDDLCWTEVDKIVSIQRQIIQKTITKYGSGKVAFTSEFSIRIQIYYSLYDLAFICLFKYCLWGRYNDNVSFLFIFKIHFYWAFIFSRYLVEPQYDDWILFGLLTTWKVYKYGVFSGPHFPVFGLNTQFTPFGMKTKICGVNFRIQSKCGKIRSGKNSVVGHFSRNLSNSDFRKCCHSFNFVFSFLEISGNHSRWEEFENLFSKVISTRRDRGVKTNEGYELIWF